MTRYRGLIAAIATATLALAASAAAQSYPDRIIEMVVPSTPGSSADILGRILGDSMGAQLGQRFVVLNKAGGSGILGTAEVARAKPDGYTLMHGAAFSVTVQPLTERQTSYTAESFEPICQTFKNDQVIVARPNSYKSVADLIAAAKDGGMQPARVDAESAGDQLVAPAQALLAGVVTKRPRAEHVEHGQVGAVPDLVEVGGAQAALHAGEPTTARVRQAFQVRRERVHARRGEQDGVPRPGHQRAARDGVMPAFAEEFSERVDDLL